VVGIFATACAVGWARQSGRFRYAAFVIVGSFALVWLVHIRIWKTHGSYTTVFSLVYFGFLTVALIVQDRYRAWHGGDRSRLTGGAIVFATAGFLVPCGTTLWCFPYRVTAAYDRAEGAQFRSFNSFLNQFPRPVALAFNPDISYLPLIAHCNFSEIMYHMGSSVGPADGRFSEQIERDRFPNYRLLYGFRVTAADYDFSDARLRVVGRPGWPKLSAPTILVPLAEAVGKKYRPLVEDEVSPMAGDGVPVGDEVAPFLASHPGWGLRHDDIGSLQWSFLPLLDAKIRDAILDQAWPEKWGRRHYAYYLVSTHLGYYLLGLSLPGQAGEADDLAPDQSSPGVRPAGNGSRAGYGYIELQLRFPSGKWKVAEPIVSTGVQGAGDILYVIYSDPGHVRIGFDHWSGGGPLTAPISIDYAREHRLDVSMGSLLPAADAGTYAGKAPETVQALKQQLRVRLDGKIVMEASSDFYESTPQQIAVGKNAINASTCNLQFTGQIAHQAQEWPK
jgi:hypothetical protein